MVFTVSVRDTSKQWENSVKDGTFRLPEECLHNSAVFQELFKYVPRRLPEFVRFDADAQRRIADASAYLLRPDIIKGVAQMGLLPIGSSPIFNMRRQITYSVPIRGRVRATVHLTHNPEELLSGNWARSKNFSEAEWAMGGELFRCLHAAAHYVTNYEGRLARSEEIIVNPMHMMAAADVIAYLLDPNDLTDYVYSEAEIKAFHETLQKEWREV